MVLRPELARTNPSTTSRKLYFLGNHTPTQILRVKVTIFRKALSLALSSVLFFCANQQFSCLGWLCLPIGVTAALLGRLLLRFPLTRSPGKYLRAPAYKYAQRSIRKSARELHYGACTRDLSATLLGRSLHGLPRKPNL